MRSTGEAAPILTIRDLGIAFVSQGNETTAVREVSLDLWPGEVVGLIGETGAGKSLTAWAVLDLVPEPGVITGGSIAIDGDDILGRGDAYLRRIRGDVISIIGQDPKAALNPLLPVGKQIDNVILAHRRTDRREAFRVRQTALRAAGVRDPERVAAALPHELSGGLAQRVLIATALVNEPRVLIADEPTTGLDVTVQADILDLISSTTRRTGTSVLLITHDLGIIANYADRAVVMFAGEVMEEGTISDLAGAPLHPYTAALFAGEAGGGPATVGTVEPPNILHRPIGCQYAFRCPFAEAQCIAVHPPLELREDGRKVRCFLAGQWSNPK